MASVEEAEGQEVRQNDALRTISLAGKRGLPIYSRSELTIGYAPGTRRSIDLSKGSPYVLGAEFWDTVGELEGFGLVSTQRVHYSEPGCRSEKVLAYLTPAGVRALAEIGEQDATTGGNAA